MGKMKITKRQLKRIIREEAKSTKKYDDDSALKGDQSELPDALQKGIIDKTVDDREESEKEDKNESTKISISKIQRIIREELALQEKKKKGLWDNIRAAQKKPKSQRNHPNSKEYQSAKKAAKKLNSEVDEADEKSFGELDEIDCWDGYTPGAQTGVKTKKGKGGKRVNNCEKIKEDDSETLEEAFIFHKNAGVGFDRNIFRPGSSMFFALFRKARTLYNEGSYIPKSVDEFELLEESEIGEFAVYEGRLVPLDYPIMEGSEEHLNEAEYQGRKVDLNKPKRGDGGKAYVYVNSGKKDKDGKIKVKKVSFGSSMADAMGDSEAHRKRRKSYGDRHNCSDKDDKTKAGYWSCRATKHFGRDIAGWW